MEIEDVVIGGQYEGRDGIVRLVKKINLRSFKTVIVRFANVAESRKRYGSDILPIIPKHSYRWKKSDFCEKHIRKVN